MLNTILNQPQISKWFGDNSFQLFSSIVGLSGWAVFLYERITSSPRIRGKILAVIVGHMPHPEKQNRKLTTFLVYLYITNQRKNPVDILDFQLEVYSSKGYQKLQRVYGLDNRKNWTFLNNDGREIIIPNFQKKLIYKNNIPVQFGQLYRGFILFGGEDRLYGIEHKKYRMTCLDAFGEKHQFITTSSQLGDLNLLQELAGISFPQKLSK